MNAIINSAVLTMSSREIAELVEKKIKPHRVGHIYVLESSLGEEVKIGRSIRPESRVRELTTISGGIGRHFIGPLVKDSVAIESALHKALKPCRGTGEYFSISFEFAISLVGDVCERFVAEGNAVEQKKKFGAERSARIWEGMKAKWGIG